MNKGCKVTKSRKPIVVGLAGLVLINALCLGMINYNSKPTRGMATVIGDNDIKCESCIDDYYDIYPDELLKVNELENYLKISKELNMMHKKLVECSTDGDELMSPSEIKLLIDSVNGEFDYVGISDANERKAMLYVQEKLVNNYIATMGYRVASNACIDIVKCITLDALDEDLDKFDKVTVPSIANTVYGSTPDDILFNVYFDDERYIVSKNGELGSLILDIYELQKNDGKANDIEETDQESIMSYNKKRNEMIQTALDESKICLYENYEQNKKGKIVKTDNYSILKLKK